jgi:hypothetical protein
VKSNLQPLSSRSASPFILAQEAQENEHAEDLVDLLADLPKD